MPWTTEYLNIVRSLDLNMSGDTRATQILNNMVKAERLSKLSKMIKGKNVVIYGCGPSLEENLHKIHDEGIHKKVVNVAVDGAVKALMEYRIIPHINITDLDGDIRFILKANEYNCVTVVHGHGDNLESLIKYVPQFKKTIYATTQSDPTDKVHNFGGFTDGDRAVHLVEHYKPRMIALAGMDFGNVVGVYSGHYDKIKKPRKLRIGKELIEKVAKTSKVHIVNLTMGGEHIGYVDKISVHKLGKLL